jgi:N-acetyl-anhydromuramyl-L-alanine amidase AmpD/peptidoglycan hydrolase-like protein with peptidoglycan-binding domain
MHKQFVGCAAANFQKGRSGGLKPEAIVIHIIGGSMESAKAQFADPATQVSAHYAVGRDGSVLQFVEEEDTAFHAGIVVSATWKGIKGGLNPNLYTIGIEHEGQPTDVWTDAQYETSAELVVDIAARWGIPLDRDHIVLHQEIRASKICPGEQFDRDKLIALSEQIAPAPPDGFREFVKGVTTVSKTNLREGRPSTQARITAVLEEGEFVTVVQFTDAGERVNGNACWYRTDTSDYLWAGATSEPHPVGTSSIRVALPQPATPNPPRPGVCGIARIDQMITGTVSDPIAQTETDRDAVSIVQDLLTGQGFRSLPGLLSPQRGIFGFRTVQAITDFQSRCSMPATGQVDPTTLGKLISAPASDPRANQAYLTLVLGNSFSGMSRVLSLVAQMEGVGKFAALNRNTDQAGLSFGLIQWAQRPGRLVEILKAFRDASRGSFVTIFGAGDAALADDLITHVSRKNGGVIKETGLTIDPDFDLIAEPWISRFQQAALLPLFQAVQVGIALAAFEKSRAAVKVYAPGLISERAVAFMIDVANQYGDGGAKGLFETVNRPGMSEADALEAIADESVQRIADKFKGGVRARRDTFLNTPLFSDEPFVDAGRAAVP